MVLNEMQSGQLRGSKAQGAVPGVAQLQEQEGSMQLPVPVASLSECGAMGEPGVLGTAQTRGSGCTPSHGGGRLQPPSRSVTLARIRPLVAVSAGTPARSLMPREGFGQLRGGKTGN